MTPEDPTNATIRRALERFDQLEARMSESLRRRSYTWAIFVARVQEAAFRLAARQ